MTKKRILLTDQVKTLSAKSLSVVRQKADNNSYEELTADQIKLILSPEQELLYRVECETRSRLQHYMGSSGSFAAAAKAFDSSNSCGVSGSHTTVVIGNWWSYSIPRFAEFLSASNYTVSHDTRYDKGAGYDSWVCGNSTTGSVSKTATNSSTVGWLGANALKAVLKTSDPIGISDLDILVNHNIAKILGNSIYINISGYGSKSNTDRRCKFRGDHRE